MSRQATPFLSLPHQSMCERIHRLNSRRIICFLALGHMKPLEAWRAERVHPHLFSVWQLGDALSFPRYSPSFRRQRAACVGTQSVFPCSVRTLCWPPVSPALHTPSTRTRTPRVLLRGGGCRCSRFGSATHFSLGKIPPASTGLN